MVVAAPEPPDRELVDLGVERAKRGGAYQMPCPKCGSQMYVHGQRCASCGTWFQGAAFVYSSREALFAGHSRAGVKIRRAAVVLAVALGVMAFVLVIAAVLK
jgi:predicted RNA-binding Zn-ribbon protein involved in translation (DUF1610 family)